MNNTLFRDELVALENASIEEIQNTLMRFFDPFWPIKQFTPEQVDVLRSIIHPEIILSYIPSKSLTDIDTQQCFALVVLDRKQENNARKIGEGHRIIYGVAGAGKTVLLIARAKWLHDRDPGAKILLLCYNVVLSVYLKNVLKDYPRIDVFHFDGWVKHNGIHSRNEDPSTGKLEDDSAWEAGYLNISSTMPGIPGSMRRFWWMKPRTSLQYGSHVYWRHSQILSMAIC